MQTDAITCNYGAKADTSNNVPVDVTAEVPAGSRVTFFWTDWQSDHPGPSTFFPSPFSLHLSFPWAGEAETEGRHT